MGVTNTNAASFQCKCCICPLQSTMQLCMSSSLSLFLSFSVCVLHYHNYHECDKHLQEVVYHDAVRLLLRRKWKLFARWAFL